MLQNSTWRRTGVTHAGYSARKDVLRFFPAINDGANLFCLFQAIGARLSAMPLAFKGRAFAIHIGKECIAVDALAFAEGAGSLGDLATRFDQIGDDLGGRCGGLPRRQPQLALECGREREGGTGRTWGHCQ